MKDYLVKDEWKIIEDKFHPEYNQISESIFSIGNGHMGQRANFEESFSGKTLQGNYIGGVYYPDKTRVGWWKNGYPEYFAKVLNSCNWIGVKIKLDDEELDIAKCKVLTFRRELDMKNGILKRYAKVKTKTGKELELISERFCSMTQLELGVIKLEIKPSNFSGNITIESYLDFDIQNQDSNYDEKFWVGRGSFEKDAYVGVMAETKKTAFVVSNLMQNKLTVGKTLVNPDRLNKRDKYIAQVYDLKIEEKDNIVLEKRVCINSNRDQKVDDLIPYASQILNKASGRTFEALKKDHSSKWHHIWQDCDIKIKGDVSAQQGIRFNIFQLYQTYSGHDSRLNIGPKGFTGEKYGGSTYWDTEAYCIPFYLATADKEIARNLLIYRYNHLQKAIENAQKLGFSDGAALYPMVTMNGEECHNEWEITFEEIHRNGAIAYAIYDYINYTGDEYYLAEYGIEVLIGIARFWAQRVNYSEDKKQYVMLGVTGPNEYENNVNNNWYTNYIAIWCMKYAKEAVNILKEKYTEQWTKAKNKANFSESELKIWAAIIDNMYFPKDEKLGIFLQQDGYLDKEQITVDQLETKHRPLNQKWSWDRILRSCFIKQADVLQGMYFFEDDFTIEELKSNFEFYEPRTVHESSLSPCVHSILACKLGMKEKAYEMYLRTSRLDLDDYNNDTEDGLHITSMAGTWLSMVKGFGGMKVKDGKLYFKGNLPDAWNEISFIIKWNSNKYDVTINKSGVNLQVLEGNADDIILN